MAGFNRTAARARIGSLLRDVIPESSDLVVMDYFEPRLMRHESIWLGNIEGASVPGGSGNGSGLRAGRKVYDIISTIPVHIGVAGSGRYRTVADACQRAQDLAEVVHDALADSWWLQERGDTAALPGVYEATVSWTNGPDVLEAEFPAAECTLVITIKSRNT